MLVMPKKKAEDTEAVNMRVSSKMMTRLDKIGEPFGLTRSEQIRRAIQEYIVRHDPEPAPKPPVSVRQPSGKERY